MTIRDIIAAAIAEHDGYAHVPARFDGAHAVWATSCQCDGWLIQGLGVDAWERHRADAVAAALRDAGLLPPDNAEARGDYARGRRDAAKAIRLAAEKEFVAGNIPSWLRPGSPIYPSAEEARRWVIDWVADIAEHGAITEETP